VVPEEHSAILEEMEEWGMEEVIGMALENIAMRHKE